MQPVTFQTYFPSGRATRLTTAHTPHDGSLPPSRVFPPEGNLFPQRRRPIDWKALAFSIVVNALIIATLSTASTWSTRSTPSTPQYASAK